MYNFTYKEEPTGEAMLRFETGDSDHYGGLTRLPEQDRVPRAIRYIFSCVFKFSDNATS